MTLPALVTVLPAAVLAACTMPGTLELALLSLAGLRRPRVPTGSPERGRLALVVPAHNEEGGIGRTLGNLMRIAGADGATDVVVIADNCTDATADVARSFGARVLEREDPLRRGKGYALDHAFGLLAGDSYLAYVVIDADSVVDEDFITAMRRRLGNGAQVVQSRYTELSDASDGRRRLSELALLAFNCLRPRGRENLGLSAGILGNGFVLRRSVLDRVPYTATSVVEDLEYHLRLVQAGYRVEFADETCVHGEMPDQAAGQATQRARWEGGRLRMLREHALPLLGQVISGKGRFIEPLLDLLLPPLAYQSLLLLALLCLPVSWGRSLAVAGFAVLALHVVCAARVGEIPARELLRLLMAVPFYALRKLRSLPALVRASSARTRWVRTERNSSNPN
ncbi:MAG: hypothetical protein RLZZ200_2571 [Pseudomonadota bacterium]|jgi:cellulose synthase/poly-beta-1,6-N-acetylglucosamine synthase-like glycosyltransferase